MNIMSNNIITNIHVKNKIFWNFKINRLYIYIIYQIILK